RHPARNETLLHRGPDERGSRSSPAAAPRRWVGGPASRLFRKFRTYLHFRRRETRFIETAITLHHVADGKPRNRALACVRSVLGTDRRVCGIACERLGKRIRIARRDERAGDAG